MPGHELPAAHGEPHVFWRRHLGRLEDCMLALAREFADDGQDLVAARIRDVLFLDYNPLKDDLPQLGDPPRRPPNRSPRFSPEPGS